MTQEPKAIVSAILIRKGSDGIEIFLQTRWKPAISPTYSGMVEIPAGGIDAYENVYDALKREVREECGLTVTRVVNDYRGPIKNTLDQEQAFVFKPFICQQALQTKDGLPWIGFVFLCEVRGEVKINPAEAKNPRWVSAEQLRAILETTPHQIFPLQLPVLRYFLENLDQISF